MISRIERFLEKNNITVLVGLCIVSLISYLVALSFYVWIFRAESISGSSSDWSAFGDYIGGVLNPFFAFMALITLIMTLHIQWREAKDSKKDAERASVEGRFFHTIGLHHIIVSDLKIYKESGDVLASGRDCFRIIYSTLFNSHQLEFPDLELQQRIKTFAQRWSEVYEGYFSCLDHYFRNLYYVLRYVDGLNDDIRDEYIKIVRAQLSAYEIVLLFCFSSSDIGMDFKAIIEQYALFQDIPKKELNLLNDYLCLYNIEAYGDLPDKYPDIDFKQRIDTQEYLAEKINKAWKEKL